MKSTATSVTRIKPGYLVLIRNLSLASVGSVFDDPHQVAFALPDHLLLKDLALVVEEPEILFLMPI
jgi:hypothetical protein